VHNNKQVSLKMLETIVVTFEDVPIADKILPLRVLFVIKSVRLCMHCFQRPGKWQINPDEPNVKILVINYTIQNKQLKYNVPFVMNTDANLWPWSHWDHHFEMKNVSNGVSWVNKILQKLQTRDIDLSVRHQKTQVDVCSGNPYLIVKKS